MRKIVLVGFIVIAFAANAFAADQIKLTFSGFAPPTHFTSKLLADWCKEVEKRTKGKVVVQFFPGQTLTKARVVYDGVIKGLSDVGFSVLGYTRGRFPVMEAVDLPLGYKNGKAANATVNEAYQMLKPKELSNTKVMFLHAHGPGLLNTRTKAVSKLEDLKGLKIRAHGTSGKVVAALGGTPVARPMPETYQLLQKGVVDGAMYPVEANKGWKLAEVIKYITLSYPAAYTTTFFVVMNKDKWNALPDDVKKTIEAINKEWIVKFGEAWDKADEEGWALVKKKGVKIIDLSPEEQKRWAAAVQPMLQNFVKEANGKGLPGDKIMKTVVELVKKNNEKYK
jgi:TRAP-type transport system periplasmic protein